jgi:hypothetical protein
VSINPHKSARPEDLHRPALKIADFQLFFSGAGLFSPNPGGAGQVTGYTKNFPEYLTRPAQSNKKKKKKNPNSPTASSSPHFLFLFFSFFSLLFSVSPLFLSSVPPLNLR